RRGQQRQDLLGVHLRQDDRLLGGGADLVDLALGRAAGGDEQRALALDDRQDQHRVAEDLGDEAVWIDLIDGVALRAGLAGRARVDRGLAPGGGGLGGADARAGAGLFPAGPGGAGIG